ncbi:MAG TPA: BRO family protein [Ktedonobacteraceae bacterium]|nr:BRO family protein [Ktedonobacteraceae bacterium]
MKEKKKNSPGAPESESADIAKKLIPLFDEPVEIRAARYQGEWYLSVNDVIKFLTGSTDPGQYWKRMRARAKTEEWEVTAQEVIELPLPDSSGRLQNTNCANRKTLLRLVQSIPGAKAEKFRLVLAELGDAFFGYVEDQSQAVERFKAKWRKQGRDEEWIEARLKSDTARNEWTTELQLRGIDDSRQFAYLTNKLHVLTFDISIRDHKALKKLPARANLQDNSTPLELLIEATSQAAATEAHRDRDSYGLLELERDVTDAAEVGKAARLAAEKMLKKPVVSSQNYLKAGNHPVIEAAKSVSSHEQMSLFETVDAGLPEEQ